MRRVERPAAKHNLAPGTDLHQPLRAAVLDTGSAGAIEQHTGNVRATADRQVGTPCGRFEIGARITAARAVLLISVVEARAFLLTSVKIQIAPVPRLHRRLDERRTQRIGIATLGHIERATLAMKLCLTRRQLRLEMFGSAEVRQHICVRVSSWGICTRSAALARATAGATSFHDQPVSPVSRAHSS